MVYHKPLTKQRNYKNHLTTKSLYKTWNMFRRSKKATNDKIEKRFKHRKYYVQLSIQSSKFNYLSTLLIDFFAFLSPFKYKIHP